MVWLDSVGLWVSVNTRFGALAEFDCPQAPVNSHSTVATKFIEALTDEEFFLQYKFSSPSRHLKTWQGPHPVLVFRLLIDGVEVDSSIARPKYAQMLDGAMVKGSLFTLPSGETMKKKFRFTAISLVDDARESRVQAEKIVAEGMGLIEVRVTRAQCPQDGLHSLFQRGDKVENNQLVFGEKSARGQALSHRTIFSNAQPTASPRYVDPTDEDRHPYAVFRFKYRSPEALRQELVIPRNPSWQVGRFAAALMRSGQPVGDKTEDNTKTAQRAIKLEPDLDADMLDVTEELPQSSLKRKREPEVIDLTDD